MEAVSSMEKISHQRMARIQGGERIADGITAACTVYGVSTVISLAATGVALPGAATVGAFCTGWMLARLIF